MGRLVGCGEEAVAWAGTEPLLISPWPDQEGNKLLFLSEWREFPSASCLAVALLEMVYLEFFVDIILPIAL